MINVRNGSIWWVDFMLVIGVRCWCRANVIDYSSCGRGCWLRERTIGCAQSKIRRGVVRMGLSGGLILAGSIGAGAVAITLASVPFVAPGLRRVCLPYVPATGRQLRHVADALSKCDHSKMTPLVDLGSGDGRVVSNY
ncbi:putative rotein [Toxocara canis]|uniref:Putative rotein n=1 Tax=Toxocara canis TaxID=6265 RepID=A0A0B2VRN8_TOXCA|nr:putative rotein [Toxocara canis]